MLTELRETRRLWRSSRFAWAEADCVLSVADHVRRVTGIDPAAPWRGRYAEAEGAAALAAEFGGVLGLARHAMALAGIREGERGEGRPVVVELAGREIAGLDLGPALGNRVMLRLERGLIDWPAPVLGAWEL